MLYNISLVLFTIIIGKLKNSSLPLPQLNYATHIKKRTSTAELRTIPVPDTLCLCKHV